MINAATLAGGTANQDRYVIGHGFAVVLDGATSVAGDRSHDPGWYAERLGEAIERAMDATTPLAEIVEQAIRAVRDAFHLEVASTPTSTVAIARWSHSHIDIYVLGDSVVTLLDGQGSAQVFTDDRIELVGVQERAAYRAHLAAGGGFDEKHRVQLLSLQREQARHRNRPGGFWIAGAEPEAARHGFSIDRARTGMVALVLASDGVEVERHPRAVTWADLYDEVRAHGVEPVLASIQHEEALDQRGRRWPRAKLHDDKTLVLAQLA
ncbi:protein phosphatase 2C domain-containing protein [Myceligenerans crystallogenes]|uniref:PPM-type phosphatase domain-containing protein n=1 Tax=Myceligenerans crystallogenes TaxID=316335 RepID=A0ABN2NAX9_9MICO